MNIISDNAGAPADGSDYSLQHFGDIHSSAIDVDAGEDVSMTGNLYGSKLHFGKK